MCLVRIFAAGLICLSTAAVASAAVAAESSTVCEVLEKPPATDTHVTLTADVLRDPRHGAFLIDAKCRGQRVGFRFADEHLLNDRAKRFQSDLAPRPGAIAQQIYTVTLSGTYPAVNSPAPRLFLVDRVDRYVRRVDAH